MAAGLHAFIEKPLATTMADVALLQDAARRHDRRIGVGLVRRQYASFKLAASVLGSGMLGAIQSFDFREGGVYNWPVATDTTFRRRPPRAGCSSTPARIPSTCSWPGSATSIRSSTSRTAAAASTPTASSISRCAAGCGASSS